MQSIPEEIPAAATNEIAQDEPMVDVVNASPSHPDSILSDDTNIVPTTTAEQVARALAVCNIPIFNLDVIHRSFICIHDSCIFVVTFWLHFDPRDLKQLNDQFERVGGFTKIHFDLSKLGKLD